MFHPSGDMSEEFLIVDSLRLSDAEWYACVNEMDRKASRSADANEQRGSERLPYRNSPYILAIVHNFDDRLQHFQVRTYDISASGIGFLHGAYIHVGTRVELVLHHRVLGATKIIGTICSCTHVKKKVHRVGAKFDHAIELDDFLLAEAG